MKNPSPDRYVAIHGHFYQPPRENPWLETIEAQESAHPYHDWNARIAAECYAPNAASRRLDGEKRIAHIGSNYARMSFNFGPTLLSWLKEHGSETYEAILQADKESLVHFSGHGSAMAQGYGHIILPLANERDLRTQVRWGVADFRHRFGRAPEGMWLPETAVDTATLEALAAEGIAFTVLAPRQAAKVRKIGDSQWIEVGNERIDPSQSYLARLPSGRSIALFFYDGPISQAIAFERLLDSGDAFVARLFAGFSERRGHAQLVHVATDGETYGHHHRFGDMALAHALFAVASDPRARLTNYAEMLAKNPPIREVTIAERSSWSCAHGVERWQSDCGCSSGTPGWNQAWRRPLRDALNGLNATLASHFEQRGGPLFHDVWAARDDYVRVMLDRRRANVEAYLGAHAKGERTAERDVLRLELLELQRHGQLMFTSCGWFFDDISGIEAMQVLMYAGRALQLLRKTGGPDVETAFLTQLAEAKSNVGEHGDGRSVYRKFVQPLVLDLPQVAAHFAVLSLFDDRPPSERMHCYELTTEERATRSAGRLKLAWGRVRVRSTITWEEATVAFSAVHFGDHNVTGGVELTGATSDGEAFLRDLEASFLRADIPGLVRRIDQRYGPQAFSVRSLFRDDQRRLLGLLLGDAVEEAEQSHRRVYNESAPVMRFLAELSIPIPKALLASAERALSDELEALFLSPAPIDVARVRHLVSEAKERSVTLDATDLEFALRGRIERSAEALSTSPHDETILSEVERLLGLLDSMPFSVDLWRAQNLLYGVIKGTFGRAATTGSRQGTPLSQWLERLRQIADKLRIRVDEGAPMA